jgi:putative PIN family toxin of toxin-antitoxin system
MEKLKNQPKIYSIILDTNLFISGLLHGGMSILIIKLVLLNKLTLLISSTLKTEIFRKFTEFKASDEQLKDLKIILDHKSIVEINPKIKIQICRDLNDNFLLELAQESEADFIVTRDKYLLELSSQVLNHTKIIKPEDFLPFLRNENIL